MDAEREPNVLERGEKMPSKVHDDGQEDRENAHEQRHGFDGVLRRASSAPAQAHEEISIAHRAQWTPMSFPATARTQVR